jgi:uncharacterized protein (TIGR03435 family)
MRVKLERRHQLLSHRGNLRDLIGKLILCAVFIGFPLLSATAATQSPSFEVATIKPTPPDWRGGRFTVMQGAHQFVARGYTLKYMVAAAYSLPPRSISGGPSWIDSDSYDILAATPGEVRPNVDEQMLMLRTLLANRFQLAYHTEHKEAAIYALTIARNGMKLKESTAPPDEPPQLISRVFPGDYIQLPARNATMAQFAAMLQRAVFNRPVLDKTGLSGKYDFDLEWTPDDTQFDGKMPPIKPDNSGKPDLFAAMQQLGLRLESSKGPVELIVIDRVERPSEN